MTREMIMNELENRGYEVEESGKVTNGVVLDGIMIRKGKINPVVYVNSYIEEADEYNLSVEEVVDKIEDVLNIETPDINIEELSNPDFILEHIAIGVQKESEEDLLKRGCEFEGLESYLFVNFKEGSFKLNKTHLSIYGLSEEELWKKAEENTRKRTVIRSMVSVMNEMMGTDMEEYEVDGLYVVSNNSTFRGAYGALDRELIKDLACKLGVKGFAVLPSSVHEMLLVPFKDVEEIDMRSLSEMVFQINNTEVAPEERLTDRAYMYQF